MEKNLYFSHSFTGATAAYLAHIERIKLGVSLPGWRLLPHFSDTRRYDPRPHAGELFRVDIDDGVAKADALVFESSYSTTGGGFECGVAFALKIPILVLAIGDGFGSSALTYDSQFRSTDAPTGGRAHFAVYKDAEHAVKLILNFLESVS